MTFLLLAAFLLPAAALVGLGLTLLAQDRDLLRQRQSDRRGAIGEAVVRLLAQAITEAERSASPAANAFVRVRSTAAGIAVDPRDGLAWVPVAPRFPEYAAAPFEQAEMLEFTATGDRGRARYESLSRSADPVIRSGALVRRARLARRQGRVDEAVAAYRALSEVTAVSVNGMPADLVARRMICDVLRSSGRESSSLNREAALLRADFLRGRWLLDRASWEVAASEIFASEREDASLRQRRTLSSAFDALYEKRSRSDSDPRGERALILVEGVPVTVISREDAAGATWLLVPPSAVETWLARLRTSEPLADVHVAAFSESGEYIAGTREAVTGWQVTSKAGDSPELLLPWTLRIGVPAAPALEAQLTARRRVLAAGLCSLILLLAGGSCLVWRVVRRELAVAQLQTDFVAAVSHEFRTPLTSLRHVTELLQESDDMPPERRRSFYAVLADSGDRLSRLVESVLDFSRIEAGRREWNRQPCEARALLGEIADDFRKAYPARVVKLEGDRSVALNVDRDALTHAVWNLLDNAVKYSPAGGVVGVRLSQGASEAAIAVSDSGIGIPAAERRDIFGRFVRGARTAEMGIKGTGLGLAMVDHIVAAHGGRVEVESEEGRGSTFIIVLPLATSTSDTSEQPAVYASHSHH